MDDKAAIRTRMKMVRDLVDDRLMRSVELWSRVAALPEYRAASTVMAFKGFKSEPDTDGLFARVAADGKRLLLPRIDDGRISVCDGDGPMTTSRIGVAEPQGPALRLDVVEFVIVPGLAFTPEGDRLGYGAGFYDRFLKELALGGQVPNAGVCFDEQIVPDLPVEAHDVRVQQVVSA
jgi:5-formyltetrahydrofolate cyclo-ligase